VFAGLNIAIYDIYDVLLRFGEHTQSATSSVCTNGQHAVNVATITGTSAALPAGDGVTADHHQAQHTATLYATRAHNNKHERRTYSQLVDGGRQYVARMVLRRHLTWELCSGRMLRGE